MTRFLLFLGCSIALAASPCAAGQPEAANAAFGRGIALQEAGRFPEAIKAYDEAIQLGADNSVAFNNRGAAYGAVKQFARALSDFDRALELSPAYAEAYCNRGAAYGALKQYDRAVRDLDKAIALDASYARAYNNLAWLLATAEEPSIRNGRRAVELALKACALSGCRDASVIDTVAAAYARKGDFAKAVEWQDRSMADPQRAQDDDAQARLKLYRARRPWPPDN